MNKIKVNLRVAALENMDDERTSETLRFHQKLVVVSHVVHYRWKGHLYAYAPYAREIDIWAEIFDVVMIAAPCRSQEPPSDCAHFESRNLGIIPQRELGGETPWAKMKLIGSVPLLSWELCKAMRQGDAIHVRCPGNLGLLGAFFAPFFSNRLVAKFAGQWSDNPNDPWSTKLQKALLRSPRWRGPVTVYGRWSNQPSHVVPFFSAAMTDAQIARARSAMPKRTIQNLRHVLFVGRLSRAKNVDVLLNALGQLRSEGSDFTATIAGEGPEFADLQQLAQQLGLSDRVEFAGGIDSDQVIQLLERSGILVLASQTEGWPKAIVEAMAFGLVTIGSQVGLIPEILGEGRGLMVPPRDGESLTTTLRNILAAPEQYSEMRAKASKWASRYSVEYLRESLRSLLAERWELPIEPGPVGDAAEILLHSSKETPDQV